MVRTKTPILQENKNYTFLDYFELNFSTEEILAEFGYELKIETLALPQGQIDSFASLEKVMISLNQFTEQ